MAFNPLTATNDRAITPPPKNELDVCTVVSIFPRKVIQTKPGLMPSHFELAPGTFDKPSVLIVEQGYWVKQLALEDEVVAMYTPSMLIANSIVQDTAVIASGGDTGPGLFYVKGSHDVISIKKNHPSSLEKARERQDRWYRELIKLADSDWSKANGNSLAISDLYRMAANELGLKDKSWLKDEGHYEKIKCIACGVFNPPELVICPNCKVVLDAKKFAEMKMVFAS
jgi:hypothetical protein